MTALALLPLMTLAACADTGICARVALVQRLAGRITLEGAVTGQRRPLLVDIAGDLPRVPERGESIGLALRQYRVFSTPG